MSNHILTPDGRISTREIEEMIRDAAKGGPLDWSGVAHALLTCAETASELKDKNRLIALAKDAIKKGNK